MHQETWIPKEIEDLLLNPTGKVEKIERLIIEHKLSAETTSLIHHLLSVSLQPPDRQ